MGDNLFIPQISITNDYKALFMVSGYGGCSASQYHFSAFTDVNQTTKNRPAFYSCDYCYHHNLAIDSSWTRTCHVTRSHLFAEDRDPSEYPYLGAKVDDNNSDHRLEKVKFVYYYLFFIIFHLLVLLY
jgi:hypothetical protein